MKYEWKKGFSGKNDAQIVGEVCEQLEQSIGLTAENLLNVSRDKDAPLHNEFEWDDGVAAEKYRTHQARILINHIAIKSEDSSVEPIRAFFQTEERKYESLNVILQCENKKRDLLSQALQELEYFERKYAQLIELSRVFEEIHKLKGE